MLDAFQSHLVTKNLLNHQSTYLLACSGGMDSMCLGNLLIRLGITFQVVHINFQLRGLESEGDQEFIQSWAKELEIPIHIKRADTKDFAQQKGISIQMAAREIRYAFFEEIRSQHQLDGIILAHHEDDQLETIFLNLLRGTGIEGVYGMADRKGWLIRPLLPFSRAEIHEYMRTNQLTWREDSSNEKSDYKRNNLRINGLPAIYGLEPDARKNLITSFQRLKDTGRAFTGLFENWKKTNIREDSGYQFLPFSAIQSQPGASTLLYFWLRPYGFNSDQAQSIAEGLVKPKIGATFKSANYLIHFDREELVLSKITEEFSPIVISEEEEQKLILPEGEYQLTIRDFNKELDKNPLHAQLDASRLKFPLEIRTWQEGDKFIPLGMNTSKKISDFLIDIKIPLAKKQDIKVLVSGKEIAWVVGLRIADWAKCTPATQRILYFKKI
ncbi:tRNA lysidine(34) synthetase TilS [Algoriphagus sp.]|uniref:tRNA lysidine(34) synthetase TilS n=1 Tax=Algoriphagus sp. TaxID=1872435 RepID=UPI00391ACCAB